ncbi:hypothetical protein JOF56_000411 [Kibdelosporangium banguiense]|uniref:Uncharacterized protein n=1 Tax=Kibdelosporangium banguiense TaxID=1365924 RepID=A0ABS4T6F7_9PSEU|nr:hypothetical protein [Kibdelosporangium banguiense]MBP2320026.1 hypothetical protein [Kibdelosporangium banguiense]
METVIGFAIGFVVGTQQGRDGLAKLRDSWNAVSTSPEVRQAVSVGVSMAGKAARQLMNGGAGKVLSGVFDRIAAQQEQQAA